MHVNGAHCFLKLRVVNVVLAICGGFCAGARPSVAAVYVAQELVFSGNTLTGAPTVVVGGTRGVNGARHAFLWDGPQNTLTDLHPAGYAESGVQSISNTQQVGSAVLPSRAEHAMLWFGTPESATDLNPAGFSKTQATAAAGDQQVGWGNCISQSNSMHALLWNGTAESAVDLNPTGASSSAAHAVDGIHQAGFFTDWPDHACVWSGSAASVIDLRPSWITSNYVNSHAYGICGEQVVGDLDKHATIWTSLNADSAVSVHPAGDSYSSSVLWSTNGTQQVGSVTEVIPGNPYSSTRARAFVWDGTQGCTNLHTLLPSTFKESQAYTLDAAGDIFGTGTDYSGVRHMILWQRVDVPEPSSLALLAGASLLLLRRPSQREDSKRIR